MPQSLVYDSASKVFVYKTDYPAVLDGAAEYLYEFAVAHCVKEAFKVKEWQLFATSVRPPRIRALSFHLMSA